MKALSSKEALIMHLIATGLTNKEIASELGNSIWTIKSHVRSILEKTHARNRTQALMSLVKCPYDGCYFGKNGDGLQTCPKCHAELLC